MSKQKSVFIGPRIKRLRRDLGLTQAQMAADIEISPSYVALIERNQRPLTADLLLKLARTYNLDLAAIAGDESDGTIAGFTKLEWSCIQTPARYLGNEVGAVHKDWDDAEVRFTMAYPEIYEVGASNLGHVVLYTILNNQPGMLCDRAYLPGDDMLQLLKSKNRDLVAVESKRPLKHFDALGMSLAYELGAVNVLEMMHLSGVPLTWKERDEIPDEVWDVENG